MHPSQIIYVYTQTPFYTIASGKNEWKFGQNRSLPEVVALNICANSGQIVEIYGFNSSDVRGVP